MLRTVRSEWRLAKQKSDFVSGVSHDLRTPLTSIRMFAEMLESGRETDESQRREYHRLIHRESVRLSRLVENVLDFSRIEEGRKTFTFQNTSLKDVIASAAETFRFCVEGLDLTVGLPEDPLPARVDPDAIVAAILNLLDNAVKYGGGKIDLSLVRRGELAVISVEDSGPGIPAEERGRIFEKFFRGSSAVAGPAGGAGLGLALVRFTVQAHGGSVSVESEAGKGSRFLFTVPLCPASSS